MTVVKNLLRPLVKFAANTVLVIVVLPVLYLIEPFWRVRISHFATERMGHLALDIYLFLTRRILDGTPKRTTHILLGSHTCNRQLLSMWQRVLPIRDSPFASTLWHYCKNILRRTRFDIPVEHPNDIYYEISIEVPRPSFTKTEENKGRELLAHMGIGPDDWFAVTSVRDLAYVKNRLGMTDEQAEAEKAESQHRVGNIEDYLLAADYITKEGGFVLRTGAIVETPLPDTGNPRIIDYSTRFRSDFGDIYLAAKARFYLGGSTGNMQVSTVFGVPVAFATMFPLVPHCAGPRSIYNPALVHDNRTGEFMHYREAFERGMYELQVEGKFYYSHELEAACVTVLQGTPEDIRDLCKDMLDQVNGIAPPAEAVAVQEFYRESYIHKMAGYRYAPSIAPRFALKYRHLIE